VYDRNALLEQLRSRALRFGDFTLASGKKAKYFLDGKQITLHSRGAPLIADGILDLLGNDLPQAIGGMSLGADPIVAAVITAAGQRGLDLAGFFVRKETKDHGTMKYIEGPVAAGDRVVIVEDVVTTGGSSLFAIDKARQFGLVVERVVAIVNRLEGGRQAFEGQGFRFDSLFTIRDFGIEPPPG